MSRHFFARSLCVTIRLMEFNPACRSCPRLYHNLQQLKQQYPDYHNRPVPLFGDSNAPLAIVGLAPGLHGANRSGRPFTGDSSGDLLFRSLFDCGFSSASNSVGAGDGIELSGCFITNAVKCVPPENRPTTREIKLCNRYFKDELGTNTRVIVALGKIAHDAVLRSFDLPLATACFGHAAEHTLPSEVRLLDTYHCSRYNVQTGRLTQEMFTAIFRHARHMLEEAGRGN